MMLTVEESVVVGVFDHDSRSAAIRNILRLLPGDNSPELDWRLRVILKKLQTMTDEEFMKIDFMEGDGDG